MKTFLIIASIAVALLACDKQKANFEGGAPESEFVPVYKRVAPKNFVSDKVVERKLIKNGRLEFATANVAEMRKEIDKIAKEFTAYIASDNQQNVNGKIEYEQVIRVPAARFDALVKVIEELGGQIDFRDVGTQDVTEEYIDVEARLKTKKELELRYLQLLKQAKNVEEMLAVETEISKVRSEIESMQGRINFLANQVGFSTLTVKYYQVTPVVLQPGFGSKLMTSFASGWHGLLVFLIGLTSVWPFILILTGSLWFISRWSKRISLRLAKKPQQT